MKKRFLSMILCGCMLAGMTGCAGETMQDDGQVTNIPVEDLADGDEQKPEELPTETIDLMDGIELMSTEWNDNFPEHPITKFGVPMFQNAVELCLKAAQVKPGLAYIGWDVAITPNGPVLIEGNILPGYDMAQNSKFHPDGKGLLPTVEAILGYRVPKA